MHKHHRITDKEYADAKKSSKANLVERTKKDRQVNANNNDSEYDSTLTLLNQN